MRYAIYSCIHSHLGRLQMVLSYLKTQQIGQQICLGDILGYGQHPNECLKLIKDANMPVVLGEHDKVGASEDGLERFNATAKEAILWTRSILSPEYKQYILSLPLIYHDKSFIAVHASPKQPEKWEYIMTFDSAIESMSYFSEQICFIGHSHIPFFLMMDNTSKKGELLKSSKIILNSNCRYLINVGSVGQPRDNNPASALVIYDSNEKSISLIRLPYDGSEETFPGGPSPSGRTAPLHPKSPIQDQEKHKWPKE